MFEARTYRKRHINSQLDSFEVRFLETDLWIGIDKGKYHSEMNDFVLHEILSLRTILNDYNTQNPAFFHSLQPIRMDLAAPAVIQEMLHAGIESQTGPMSAVAGSFAKYIGITLIHTYNLHNVAIENGGDIFLHLEDMEIDLPVFAGDSPISEQIGFRIKPHETPLGICTSSGQIGHSQSFGKAHAVTIASKNIALADAFATSICNSIQDESDVGEAISKVEQIRDIDSCIVIMNKSVGIKGSHEMLFLR